MAQCTDPVITSTSGPGSICVGEIATLSVTHDGQEVKWYDAATGGNEIGMGSPFTTPTLTSDASYWAEAINYGSATVNSARSAPAGNGQYSIDNSGCGLVINVTQNFTLNSFEVYHDGAAGSTTVELRDGSGAVVDSHTFNVPAGSGTTPHVIPVDFDLQANETYWIIQTIDFKMVRELGNSLPNNYYPLSIDNVGSITSAILNGNPGSQNYYYFYNWEITTETECYSSRVEEAIIVTDPAMPVGNNSQTFESGETLADLDVTGQNLQWYSDSDGTTPLPDTTELVDGTTYYVSQTTDGCESELLDIIVTETLGVSDSSLQNLSIFPTTVENTIYIENNYLISTVEVYNILGKKFIQKEINASKTSEDVSQLSSGIYLVKISTDGGSKTLKIIKK
ncbi:T9SS type A sorting domain-containing protein [Mesonia maritima]|uniref:Secretion system C-terminal sorting domain-containing protein n=1 Tax=Mesonia maritima TaxID=1793873 RepID=A0ABU1K481_9FLAO|nr:T9SS type A sorting domain-containing protein [Mesonia maritima]MDR6300406.1 hypothetical protein [Mesonia maritima]